MKRSIERIRLKAVETSPGTLTVGGFQHPERGPVDSPATPLILSDLRRRGLSVTEGFLHAASGHDSASGVTSAVSYVDGADDTVGFAIAADVSDVEGLHAAEAVVAGWASVLRTRRVLLASGSTECAGTRHARQLAGLGDSAGLSAYPAGTSAKRSGQGTSVEGSRTAVVCGPVTMPHDEVAFYPAHGVPASVRAALDDRGARVVDGTCPLVLTMEEDVRRLAARGDCVVLIGGHGHAVIPTLISHAPGSVVLIESEADVRNLQAHPERVSFVVAGGVVVEDAAALLAILRRKYPRLRGQHPNNMCYAASDDAETLRSVASAADVVLILGEDDQHTGKLTAAARKYAAGVHRMSTVGDLRREWIATAATVGVVSSPTGYAGFSAEVVDAIGGLGPLSVAHRGVVTEVVKTR